MTMIKDLQGDWTFAFFVPGVAAGTGIEWPLLVVPFNMRLTAVKWVPAAAVVADGTNYATLSFRNRAAGAGTVVPASRAYSATNSAARVAEAMTLSGTDADLNLAAGDVLTLGVAHSGTGLIIPAGLVQATVRGR